MAEDLRSALHLSNEYQLMKQIKIILQYSYRHALFASDTHTYEHGWFLVTFRTSVILSISLD
jgi:hypothetical protein